MAETAGRHQPLESIASSATLTAALEQGAPTVCPGKGVAQLAADPIVRRGGEMRLVDWIEEATRGPGAARFLLQPAVAIWLAVRDGRRDAKDGYDPFLYRLAFHPGDRSGLLHSAWKTLLIPLLVAFVLDSILQAILMGSYRPRSSIGVAVLLIALPYSLARAGSCRLWKRKHRHP